MKIKIYFFNEMFRIIMPEIPSWKTELLRLGAHFRQGQFCFFPDMDILRSINKAFCPEYTPEAIKKIDEMKYDAVKNTSTEDIEAYCTKHRDCLFTSPRPHQKECLYLLHLYHYYGLFLQQGLGKTKIILDDFVIKRKTEPKLRLLVICRNYNVNTWIREIKKHQPKLRFVVLHKGTKNKMKAIQTYADVYITNIEGIAPRRVSVKSKTGNWYKKEGRTFYDGLCRLLCEGGWYGAIDESTIIKSPRSRQTEFVLRLRENFRYRRILTGTPIPKDIRDIWGQLSYLDEKASGFATYRGFESYHCVYLRPPRQFILRSILYEDEIKAKIKKWSVRKLRSECIKLPPQIFKRIDIEMLPEQRRIYNEIKDECYTEFKDMNEEDVKIQKTHILARAECLLQITKGFIMDQTIQTGSVRLLQTLHNFPSPKYDVLKRLIEDELQGQKILIWTRHIHEKMRIADMLGKKAVRADTLEDIEAGFDKHDIMIMSYQSHCHGLNLQRTDVHIRFSRYWNWEWDNQAADRSQREGLDHSVVYYDLVMKDSVDIDILKNLTGKGDFASEFVDGIKKEGKKC